jgi:hypothetical protein
VTDEKEFVMKRRTRWPWYGAAFGSLLFVFGLGSLGAGHGTELPLTVFAAPVSAVPGIGFFAAPFWWAAIAWVLKRGQWWWSFAVMSVHTTAVGLILRYGDGRETVADQWHYFHQFERFDPKWLWGGIGIYLVGGLTAWLLALTVRPVGQTSSAG